jgi:hypothetical protein
MGGAYRPPDNLVYTGLARVIGVQGSTPCLIKEYYDDLGNTDL